MEVEEVNENGNFIIQVKSNNKWHYITTEFSVSTAITVADNLHITTSLKTRVFSKRNDNKILYESN
jgi:hypothetical protein